MCLKTNYLNTGIFTKCSQKPHKSVLEINKERNKEKKTYKV